MAVDFDSYLKMRSVAQRRARELVAFLTEKCEPNDAVPPDMKPESLKEEMTQIFYESEKTKNGL